MVVKEGVEEIGAKGRHLLLHCVDDVVEVVFTVLYAGQAR